MLKHLMGWAPSEEVPLLWELIFQEGLNLKSQPKTNRKKKSLKYKQSLQIKPNPESMQVTL